GIFKDRVTGGLNRVIPAVVGDLIALLTDFKGVGLKLRQINGTDLSFKGLYLALRGVSGDQWIRSTDIGADRAGVIIKEAGIFKDRVTGGLNRVIPAVVGNLIALLTDFKGVGLKLRQINGTDLSFKGLYLALRRVSGDQWIRSTDIGADSAGVIIKEACIFKDRVTGGLNRVIPAVVGDLIALLTDFKGVGLKLRQINGTDLSFKGLY